MIDFKVELPNIKDEDYIVEDYKTLGHDPKINKDIIQYVIDKCSLNGGGRVILPSKIILSGPIVLKSGVNLYLPFNCYLKFPKIKEFYTPVDSNWEGIKRLRCNSPISANGQYDIAITGRGTIDGDGFSWRPLKEIKVTKKFFDNCLNMSPYFVNGKQGRIWYPSKSSYDGCIKTEECISKEDSSDYYDYFRPVLLSLINCNRILLEGVIFSNSPAWNIHPLFCKNLTLDNVVVKNEYYAQNGDGIDVESCNNVEIKNSTFEVGDDGICIKSGKNKEARKIKIPSENIYIHDSIVYHAHGGIVIGSEMSRGVNNVYCDNLTFVGTDIGIRFKSALGRGGVVSNIYLKNINMTDILAEAMIFNMDYSLYKMDHELTDDVVTQDSSDIPYFNNIYIDNIYCNSSKCALKVVGINEDTIKDIYISNSYIKSLNTYTLKKCSNIYCKSTTFNINGNIEYIEDQKLELDKE